MDHKNPCVYILCNKPNCVLYIGVTSNLASRIWQHKQKVVTGFCKRYNVDTLVWYELYTEMTFAINREKQLKKWNRSWKIKLIESFNPSWRDLNGDILG